MALWTRPYQQLTFTNVSGREVPSQPWPQVFYIADRDCYTPAVVLRPLTLTGFAKGVARNFVTMNYWRLMYVLARAGFLATEPGCFLSWRDWRWNPVAERRRRRTDNAWVRSRAS